MPTSQKLCRRIHKVQHKDPSRSEIMELEALCNCELTGLHFQQLICTGATSDEEEVPRLAVFFPEIKQIIKMTGPKKYHGFLEMSPFLEGSASLLAKLRKRCTLLWSFWRTSGLLTLVDLPNGTIMHRSPVGRRFRWDWYIVMPKGVLLCSMNRHPWRKRQG